MALLKPLTTCLPIVRFSAICLFLIGLVFKTSLAADPQPYTVTIADLGNAGLQQILHDSSTLISLNESSPVGSFALVARAREDKERLTTALHSQGYYKAIVTIKIAGRPLDDPGIFDTIDYSPADPPVQVIINVDAGPRFKLGNINIAGTVPKGAVAWLGLTPDTPALASAVLNARGKLLKQLFEKGYALAKVDEPIAQLSLETNTLNVSFPVKTGPIANFGDISITGLQRVRKRFARRQIKISPGQRFNPTTIEQARQALLATGVFATVRPKVAKKLDRQGQIPVDFVVAERPLHSTTLGGAFSTDLGGSLFTTWEHHNVLGGAEQINLTAGVTQLGGNSTTGIGYKFAVGYTKPDFLQRGQSFNASIGALRQSLSAYRQESVLGGIGLSRVISKHWTAAVGLDLEQSNIIQENVTRDYTLFSIPLSAKHSSINDPLDPTKGSLFTIGLTPYQSLVRSDVDPFAVIQLSGSTYLNLAKPGRSVLALRGLLGDIEGAGQFSLPPNKRFYAGGGSTVRGYRYQSIGPQFADGIPQGGTAIATGTVELRQRILDNYGFVAFADAGQVSPNDLLLSGAWRVGAGIGARYYTSFGPLRVDIALPLTKQSNSGTYEIYIGLGQAF